MGTQSSKAQVRHHVDVGALDRRSVDADEVRELVTDAYLPAAPERLATLIS